ncbi:MAG TPA: hypothetical protein HA261_11550 [Methanosarcina sp.]|nr:hypothetical protein [Methanosarcina sp.]
MNCGFCDKIIIDNEKQCTKIFSEFPIQFNMNFCSKECKILYELFFLESIYTEEEAIDIMIDEEKYTEEEIYEALMYLEKTYPASLTHIDVEVSSRGT